MELFWEGGRKKERERNEEKQRNRQRVKEGIICNYVANNRNNFSLFNIRARAHKRPPGWSKFYWNQSARFRCYLYMDEFLIIQYHTESLLENITFTLTVQWDQRKFLSKRYRSSLVNKLFKIEIVFANFKR